MKALFLILLVSTSCLAQKKYYTLADMPFTIDSTTGGIVYSGVVEVANASADELYTRGKSFLLKLFTNESAVIQVDDKPGGLLGAKGKYTLPISMVGLAMNDMNQIYYELPIEIRVKEGRYRYEISNLELVSRGIRYKIDDLYKKRPHAYDKMSENQYKRYISKDPVVDIINKLKTAMGATAKDKNDF